MAYRLTDVLLEFVVDLRLRGVAASVVLGCGREAVCPYFVGAALDVELGEVVQLLRSLLLAVVGLE